MRKHNTICRWADGTETRLTNNDGIPPPALTLSRFQQGDRAGKATFKFVGIHRAVGHRLYDEVIDEVTDE